MMTANPIRVAYLLNQYPKISHAFIRREIVALEAQGIEVLRIAIRGWNDRLVDEEDRSERKRTRYVLDRGPMPLAVAVVWMLFTAPVRLVLAFWLACRMGWRAERPLPIHLIYLAEACFICKDLQRAGIQHLHAHFGTNAAEVAMLTHALGGPSWSFTVHGPEEFDKPGLIGMVQKLSRCSFVVAVSSFGRSQLFRLLPHSAWPKVHVVHCSLEAIFEQEPPVGEYPKARFVCVGRLAEQKGHLLLLQAVKGLIERGLDIELALGGDGELRDVLEGTIKEYNLSSYVRITGWLTGAEVREEILRSRALVLPSFAEGLPVVLMEAMALRRPVISTYIAGIPELVRPRENGWLVPAGSVKDLESAIEECIRLEGQAILKMGQAARANALLRHNQAEAASRLASLFRSAIAQSDSRSRSGG